MIIVVVIWSMHLADAVIQSNFQCIQDKHASFHKTTGPKFVETKSFCITSLGWSALSVDLLTLNWNLKSCFVCKEWETGFVFNTRPAAESEDSLQYPFLLPLECCSYLSVRRADDLSTNIHILRRGARGAHTFLSEELSGKRLHRWSRSSQCKQLGESEPQKSFAEKRFSGRKLKTTADATENQRQTMRKDQAFQKRLSRDARI